MAILWIISYYNFITLSNKKEGGFRTDLSGLISMKMIYYRGMILFSFGEVQREIQLYNRGEIHNESIHKSFNIIVSLADIVFCHKMGIGKKREKS